METDGNTEVCFTKEQYGLELLCVSVYCLHNCIRVISKSTMLEIMDNHFPFVQESNGLELEMFYFN